MKGFVRAVERFSLVVVVALAAPAIMRGGPLRSSDDTRLKAAIRMIEEWKTPGLEAELSGIYPHPTDNNLYYVLANLKPPYRPGQKPMLPEQYRGKLLTVNKWTGEVVKAVHMADDDFGGLVMAEGHFYVALTTSAKILKVDPNNLEVLAQYALPSPPGGVAYDKDRGILLIHLYVGHPHLAVMEIKTGRIVETLYSDESTMGLVKVDGDWICTWASSWDPGAFSEVHLIDQKTGRVRSRIRVQGVHTCLAPDKDGKGGAAFACLVTVDSSTGKTVIRKYGYVGESRWEKVEPISQKTTANN
ncbi:MAG TPA: hypothetical protein VF747_13585 [Blastocatellia bacterium]|jgi:hypothetical protein